MKTIIAATTLAVISLGGAALAADHQVTIAGFAFQPANLTVAAGDTVTFVNKDGAPHTATARDKSFDTGRLSGGQSKTITVSAAGTFNYKCRFHPAMTGKITAN